MSKDVEKAPDNDADQGTGGLLAALITEWARRRTAQTPPETEWPTTLSALLDLHYTALGGNLEGYADSRLRDRVEALLGHVGACGCLGRPAFSGDATDRTGYERGPDGYARKRPAP